MIKDFIDKLINNRAAEYGVDSEDFNLVSTNGMIADSMVDILEDIEYKFLDRETESFLVTSRKKESLIKYSRIAKRDIISARPASMDVLLTINLSDLLEVADEFATGDKWLYTISKFSTITFGDINFSIPYDIKIYVSETNNGSYTVSAAYDIDESNPIVNIANPNLKVIYNTASDEIMLFVNINQYKIKSIELHYVNKMVSRTLSVDYTNQLIQFNVYNQYLNTKELLNKAVFLSDVDPSLKNIFYIIKDNKIILNNKYEYGNFIPNDGSKFIIEIFESLGENGNMEYEGSPVPLKNEYDDGLVIRVTNINSATGGVSELTDNDLRTDIISYMNTRNSLITENDISSVLKKEDSSYKVVKLQDNILYRIYGIYSLLKYKDTYLPTNTLDVEITSDESLVSRSDFVLPNAINVSRTTVGDWLVGEDRDVIISYMNGGTFDDMEESDFIGCYIKDSSKSTNIYVITAATFTDSSKTAVNVTVNILDILGVFETNSTVLSNQYLATKVNQVDKIFTVDEHTIKWNIKNNDAVMKKGVYVDSIDKFIYTFPYTIIFNRGVNSTGLKVYESSIDKTYNTEYVYMNPSCDVNYMLNRVNISKTRNNSFTNHYEIKFKFEFRTNSIDPTLSEHILTDVSLYLELDLSTEHRYIPCTILDYVEDGDYFNVEAILQYNPDTFSIDGGCITELYSIINDTTTQVEVNLKSLTFDILAYTNDTVSYINTDPNLSLDKPIIPDKTLVNVYSIEDAEVLKDVTYIMNLQHDVTELSGDSLKLKIFNLPVIKKDVFFTNQKDIVNLIQSQITKIDSMLENVKDDCDISLLYANTHGYSKLFKVGLTNKTDLSRTDLSLEFNVVLKYKSSLDIEEIKDYIKTYIMNLDFYNGEDFHFSRMIKDIKTEYTDIDIIELVKINGVVENSPMISYDIKSVVNRTVPEVLNIRTQNGIVDIIINIL